MEGIEHLKTLHEALQWAVLLVGMGGALFVVAIIGTGIMWIARNWGGTAEDVERLHWDECNQHRGPRRHG